MAEPIECPQCAAMNRPGTLRCRVCGAKLRESAPRPADVQPPVVLRRVMSSEVFTARLGDIGKREAESAAPTQAAQTTAVVEVTPAPVEPPPEPSVEDNSDVIASAVDRIRTKAQENGHRFKPYVSAKGRRPATPHTKQEAAKHLESAVALMRERRFEESIEPLLKAIARDDEDRRSWILLAETYLRLNRPFKAAVGYLRALELSPKDEQAWLGLARVLRAIDDLATAAAVLDRATRINPRHADSWAERGAILEALQNPTEAMKSFTQVLALRPGHAVAQAKQKELATKLDETAGDHEPAAPEPDEAPTASEAAVEESSAPAAEPAEPVSDDIIDQMGQVFGPEGGLTSSSVHRTRDVSEKPSAAAPASSRRPARVRTFVEGLDDTLEGGIPWGHVVLIEGAPGTMKSSLGFSILLNNATREGLHCVYLSLEERTSSLLKQMGSLGLKLEVRKGSLVVLDPKTASNLFGERDDWVAALREGIASIKEQRGLDLIVIDSLEALEVLAKFKDRRREMYRLFEWLRDLGVTSFVITERPDWLVAGHVLQGRWDEDFLADGVVHLRIHMVSDLDAQRRLRVVKMRGTKHETGYLAMVLDDGRFKVTRAMGP